MTAQATRKRTNLAEEFFNRLAAQPQPLLHDVEASIRIELDEHGRATDSWLLRIDHGRVRVSRRGGKADAAIKTDRVLFDQMVTGEVNSVAAALRGRLRLDGDIRLLVVFGRLLPGPPSGTTVVPPPDRTAKAAASAVKAPGTAPRSPKFSQAAARAARKDSAR